MQRWIAAACHTTTNQQQAATMEERWAKRRFDEQEAYWKQDIIAF
jgi:hypothetical protein